MRDIPRADHGFEFVGGSVALDFANTLGGMHTAGTLSRTETRRLIEDATQQPARAAAVLRRAIGLREAIWRVFDAFAKSERAGAADLAAIQEEELAALKHARFAQNGSDVAYRWSDELLLDRPLWDIARSASELLRSKSDLSRVRECGSNTCEWLFIDKSRNHSRRWCDMKDCGNAAKVRRFRQRQRAPRARTTR